MALYQGIERKYFNSTVKLPDLHLDTLAILMLAEYFRLSYIKTMNN